MKRKILGLAAALLLCLGTVSVAFAGPTEREPGERATFSLTK